ncbi:MAG: hypothetical protein ACIAQZ_08350 [Sedimentisphaeraceae bacterium JB056]
MKKMSFIILLTLAVVPMSLMADTLLYDGFDYSAGTLTGNNGGDGWNGQWWANTYNVVETSLDMPNLLFTPVGGSAEGYSDMNRMYPGVDFSSDGIYYLSYLCKRTGWTSASSGEWAEIVLRTTDYAYLASWGISSAENFQTSQLGATQSYPGGDTSEVLFLVGKLITKASGNDEIFLQVYTSADSIPTVEPEDWMISGGAEDESLLSERFTVRAGSASGYLVGYDEFRLTTTWADAVAPAKDGSIVYLTPQNSAEAVTPVTFTWQGPAAIETPTYKLYYSSTLGEVDPNDVTPDIAPVTLTETTYGPASLDINTDYYWRVDIVDGTNVIVGNIVSFSTIPPIFPVAPEDGAVDQARNVTLSWDSEITLTGNYQVYMGDSAETLSYVGMSTGTSFSPDFLDWGQTYYWQVVYDDGVDVIESSVWSFTVDPTIDCDGTLVADFDGNCITNTADLAMMAEQWLNCTIINDSDCKQ